MGTKIIDLEDWIETPAGRYLLAWETDRFDQAVVDIFGYHAVQLGLPQLQVLTSNRMPHQFLACERSHTAASIITDFAALPFPEGSLDLVALPHSLELSPDPHATLREVERVLVPEGRVVISCFNPASLWGLRQRRARLYRRFGLGEPYLPETGEFIAYRRLRDWLRLLGFEVESSRFGCYRPALQTGQWLDRFAWMDQIGARWWPIFGSAYVVVAAKRVRGMRLISAPWKVPKTVPAAPVSIAGKHLNSRTSEEIGIEPH
jgi:SAM-dependent methyltransferase